MTPSSSLLPAEELLNCLGFGTKKRWITEGPPHGVMSQQNQITHGPGVLVINELTAHPAGEIPFGNKKKKDLYAKKVP